MPIAVLVLTDAIAIIEATFDFVASENVLPFALAGVLMGLFLSLLKRGFRFGRG